MIMTRPVRFTTNMAPLRTMFQALGGQCLADYGSWVVYGFDGGRIALHAADEHFPGGVTTFGFETDDLAALAARSAQAAPAGVHIAAEETQHGVAAVVRGVDGTVFTVDSLTEPVTTTDRPEAAEPAGMSAGVLVAPLWFTHDTATAVDTLTALGAQPRIGSTDGGWTDLRTDSGLVAVHTAASAETVSPATEASVGLSFEHTGNIDHLLGPLQDAGIEATIIDESYGRSLRMPDPDRPGEQIWINEQQQDLYGYRALGD
ncbi:MAG TPA: hypothetical protein VK095_15230 [Beutenbergiaceae bacterium]|nr:hypothetical protein [Beutenbergiaceae bacterium]